MRMMTDICQKKGNSPMAKKSSLTFMAVLADVSIKSKPVSSAYVWASYTRNRHRNESALISKQFLTKMKSVIFSWVYIPQRGSGQEGGTSYSTSLFSARSALFPARAITMLGLACLCSSFTQALALSNVSWVNTAPRSDKPSTHVNNVGTWKLCMNQYS